MGFVFHVSLEFSVDYSTFCEGGGGEVKGIGIVLHLLLVTCLVSYYITNNGLIVDIEQRLGLCVYVPLGNQHNCY